jgi:hypothetical protein
MEMVTNGCCDTRTNVFAFYRLAFLLTGDRDISVEIAADAATPVTDQFALPDLVMKDGRRLVIEKAVAALHEELSESARRTQRRYSEVSPTMPPERSVVGSMTRVDLELALLAIDMFPRVVLLALVFEGLGTTEAAALLDADLALLKQAQVIGLCELSVNIAARMTAAAAKEQHT